MDEGKPYRRGLVAAGLGVVCVGLFIMGGEKPHVYGTMCALGVVMLCAGTVWSLCRCYPKVVLGPGLPENPSEEVDCISDEEERLRDPAPEFPGHKCERSRDNPQSHSCPTLHLV